MVSRRNRYLDAIIHCSLIINSMNNGVIKKKDNGKIETITSILFKCYLLLILETCINKNVKILYISYYEVLRSK